MPHRSHRRRLATVALLAVVALSTAGCALGPLAGALDRAVDQALEEQSAGDADGGTESGGSEAGGTESGGPEADDDLGLGGADSDDGNTPIGEIVVGDCLNDEEVSLDEGITSISSLDVVDCAGPHDSEVYGAAQYDLDRYPGDEEIDRIAGEQCFDLFESFVGLDYDSSSLDFSYYTPSRVSWKYGDRDAICVLYDVDLDTLTGSARGSAV